MGLDVLMRVCDQLKQKAQDLNIKGTILLSTEGINAFVAGSRENIDAYVNFLRGFPEYADLGFKESESSEIPFTKILVRIKNEIVTMGHSEIQPEKSTAPYISPETLKQWYDEKRDFIIVDTRNDYEYALGTFDQAVDLNIESFREFPDAVQVLPAQVKQKPVVTFCTGGIRCEKAAELMSQKGFKEVYQLEGGILNYFEKIGSDHYHGECFVFDKRLSVDSNLAPTTTDRCYEHTGIENADQLQQSINCPYCQHLKTSRQLESVKTA